MGAPGLPINRSYAPTPFGLVPQGKTAWDASQQKYIGPGDLYNSGDAGWVPLPGTPNGASALPEASGSTQYYDDRGNRLSTSASGMGVGGQNFGTDPFQLMAQSFTLQNLSIPEIQTALTGTHLGSLLGTDKYIGAQTKSLVQASEWFKKYSTGRNEDGTYNIYIPQNTSIQYFEPVYGTNTNTMDQYQTDQYSVEGSPWQIYNIRPMTSEPTQEDTIFGTRSGLTIKNMQLFDDYGAASEAVLGGLSPLANMRKSGINSMATSNVGRYQDSKANAQKELQTGQEYLKRRQELSDYNRNKNKKTAMRTGVGAGGTGGLDESDTLKLGIPTLLGIR